MKKVLFILAFLAINLPAYAQSNTQMLKQHQVLVEAMKISETFFNNLVSSITTWVNDAKAADLKEDLEKLYYTFDEVENQKSRLLAALKKKNGWVTEDQLKYQRQLLQSAQWQCDKISKNLTLKFKGEGQEVANSLRKAANEKGPYIGGLGEFNKMSAEEKQEVLSQGEELVKSIQAANLALVKLIDQLPE